MLLVFHVLCAAKEMTYVKQDKTVGNEANKRYFDISVQHLGLETHV